MWCALDAVDEENGSLSYLPASHAAGLRDHHASWVKGFSQSIKDFTPEDSGAMVEVADLQLTNLRLNIFSWSDSVDRVDTDITTVAFTSAGLVATTRRLHLPS